MRIGLVIYGRLDTLSGGYLYDRQLVDYLRTAGDTVEIISLPWANYGRHLTYNFSTNLRKRLQDGHFDVLLQDELNHPSLFLLNAHLRGRIAYPIVAVVHHLRSSEQHPAWQRTLYRAVEWRYLRSVDGFIFNSRTTHTAVEALANAAKPTVVAYPAADHRAAISADSAVGAADSPLRVLFVGNIIPRKGLHVLLAALARLPAGSWHLAIVGDEAVDPEYARLSRALAEVAGIEGSVVWHGRVSDRELTHQFAQNDVLAVPSSYEGFGIVYLEALAHGLPAIATTAGAAGEIITDGVNGFLIPPEDVAALAGALNSLQTDRARLDGMRRAARARYLAAPTWADSMTLVREFLLRITAV